MLVRIAERVFSSRILQSVGSLALIAGLVFGIANPASAGMATYTGTGGPGNTLSASATFNAVGSNLIISLTNTSLSDVLVPADILHAIFFNLAGNQTLTRVSAVLGSGSVVVYGPGSSGNNTNPGNDVGSEFGYVENLSGAPGGALYGISSAGYDLFGSGDVFPGPDLDKPTSPNGLNYGILSAGDDTSTGNSGVTKEPHILNSVVFTLSGLSAGFDPMTGVSNVSFQYGTDLSEPGFPGTPRQPEADVPEPSTLVLGLLGALGMAASSRLRRRRR